MQRHSQTAAEGGQRMWPPRGPRSPGRRAMLERGGWTQRGVGRTDSGQSGDHRAGRSAVALGGCVGEGNAFGCWLLFFQNNYKVCFLRANPLSGG